MMLRRPIPQNRRCAVGPADGGSSAPALVVPGAQFWIHGAQGMSESGGNLTGWTDGSGNGRDCTLIGTPTVDATGWLGKPVAKFNGSSSGLRAGAGAGETIGGVRHEATIVTLFELVSVTTYNMIVGFGLAGSTSFTNCQLMYTSATDKWKSFRNSATYAPESATTMVAGKFCMIERLKLDGGVLKNTMWLNNTAQWTDQSVDVATNFTFDRYIFGRSPADGGTPYWTEMNLAEAILYDSALSDTQVANIYAGMSAYWGGI